MELRQFLSVLRTRFWWVILGVVLATAATYWVSKSLTPIYQASALLMVEQRLPDPGGEYGPVMTSQRLAATYSSLVEAPEVLDQVVRDLNLPLNAAQLKAKVSTSFMRESILIRVTAEDPDPVTAAAIANKTVEVFAERNATLRQARYATTLAKLEADLAQAADTQDEAAHTVRLMDGGLLPYYEAMTPEEKVEEKTSIVEMLNRSKVDYAVLFEQIRSLQIEADRYGSNIVIASDAKVPAFPAKPRVLVNTVLAGFLGLVLSFGLASVREYLDDTVKRGDDVDRELGLNCLGVIGRIGGTKSEGKLVTHQDPKSPISEAYRALRTNLQFSAVGRPLRTILVTSPSPNEGKTLTAANLGVVMAQAGKSVIIVDSDLRRPGQHRLWGTPHNPGLTDFLAGDGMNVDERLKPTGVDNLRVLPAGALPPNPSELLGLERMRQLIEALKSKADVIIFDSPPSLVVTDAAVLASQVDGVVMVAESGATRRQSALKAKEDLSKTGAHILGLVLNKLSRRQASGYYQYYYYYAGGEKKQHRRHAN